MQLTQASRANSIGERPFTGAYMLPDPSSTIAPAGQAAGAATATAAAKATEKRRTIACGAES